MVKRLVFALLFLGFGVLVLGLSFWRSLPPVVTVASEEGPAREETPVSPTASVTTGKDFYPLPYPGMLPDHPLYFLKMIRDRIQLWLTRGPQARAELLLHYADKRVAAALALAEKGKAGLAASTGTKAELYLEQALEEGKRLSSVSGEQVAFYRQAVLATAKHEQVLVGVLSRVPDEAKPAVEAALEKSRRGHQQVVDVVGGELKSEDDEDSLDVEDDVEDDGEEEEDSLPEPKEEED